MINTRFEAYKIKREIKRSGTMYKFMRHTRNEFGEPTSESRCVGIVHGLYHEQNSTIGITTGDTTQVRNKKIPMILCLTEEIQGLKFQVGDYVAMSSRDMKITGIVDVQEWCIVSDISLEVVDNGAQARI